MIEADCSLKYVLLIYALFIARVGIITLTVCTILIAKYSLQGIALCSFHDRPTH